MIQPEEIRRKAERLYASCLEAWLKDDERFFPYEIRSRKRPQDTDLAVAIRSISNLRKNSKETLGYGYAVSWQEINSRTFGRNKFPSSIFFETREDLLRFIGKQREFARLVAAVQQIRHRFPQLEGWIRVNPGRLIEAATDLDGLLEVLDYFCCHPRPNCFARELPLSVDSKYIERHQSLLREWFDVVLPPHTIRADEQHFERRYGLRYAEPHLLLRMLDPEIQKALAMPFPEISLPLSTVAGLSAPAELVLIVENKVNLLTLPHVQGAIGLGALGRGVTLLRNVEWLHQTRILYWGDIDVEGFQILSALRSAFPQTSSLLMDRQSLDQHEAFAGKGTASGAELPPYLSPEEQAVFLYIREKNLRLEQERIPPAYLSAELAKLLTYH
jgi:hypothetical protein